MSYEYLRASIDLLKMERDKGIAARVNQKAKRTKPKNKNKKKKGGTK